jgi:hypothetical protein
MKSTPLRVMRRAFRTDFIWLNHDRDSQRRAANTAVDEVSRLVLMVAITPYGLRCEVEAPSCILLRNLPVVLAANREKRMFTDVVANCVSKGLAVLAGGSKVNSADGHHWYAEFLPLVGRHEQAIADFERADYMGGGSSVYAASLAHALAIAGRRTDALKVLQDFRKTAETRFVSSYDLALAQVALGDEAKTFELLRAAVQERSPRVAFLGVEPRFDRLRPSPEFRELLRAIGLQL